MIADDTNAIRDAMRKLAQAKVQAEAEAARKAASDDSAVNLPHPKPLFSESCPPFPGFCLGDPRFDVANENSFDPSRYADACDEWDNATLDSAVTGLDPKQPSLFMWGKLD